MYQSSGLQSDRKEMRITQRSCHLPEFLLLPFLLSNLTLLFLTLTLGNDPMTSKPKRHIEDCFSFPASVQLYLKCDIRFLTSLALLYPFHISFIFLIFKPFQLQSHTSNPKYLFYQHEKHCSGKHM